MSKIIATTIAALLLTSSAAFAQGTSAAAPVKPAAAKSTPMTATPAATKNAPAGQAYNTGTSHQVKASTKNGKSVTYDCSKAGNKSKTACKAGAR